MFTSPLFIIGFPMTCVAYYIVPEKYRKVVLLFVSYLFCYGIMPAALIWLMGVTALSFWEGRWIAAANDDHSRKIRMSVAVLSIVVTLMLGRFGHRVWTSIVAPIGISFYSMEVIGYLVDVYHERVSGTQRLCDYALYVAFFPKLLSGPIEKSTGLLQQVANGGKCPLYETLHRATILIMWGYFEKLVISDHAAIFVAEAFDHYAEHSGIFLLKCAVLYGIQLYADFDGYSNIARGCAGILGYGLTVNFQAPYMSQSIQDFWRRWHISLSDWLKTYIYIPLGGNRKGKERQYINLLMTFLVSGLWHGNGVKFLVWGGIHGVYQIAGKLTMPLRNRLCTRWHINTECLSHRVWRSIVTFLLVDFAWILFRANSLRDGLQYILRIVTDIRPWDLIGHPIGTVVENVYFAATMWMGIVILFVVDIMKTRQISVYAVLLQQNTVFRRGLWIMMSLFIIGAWIQVTGTDVSSFIYAAF